jgi:uncharacterized protein YjcR
MKYTKTFKKKLLKKYLSSAKISTNVLASMFGVKSGTIRNWSKNEGWYKKKMYL